MNQLNALSNRVEYYAKGQKNDFRDAEAIAEAVQNAPSDAGQLGQQPNRACHGGRTDFSSVLHEVRATLRTFSRFRPAVLSRLARMPFGGS
jgi:hypothetical protein